jgi:hypothetical protein
MKLLFIAEGITLLLTISKIKRIIQIHTNYDKLNKYSYIRASIIIYYYVKQFLFSYLSYRAFLNSYFVIYHNTVIWQLILSLTK